MLEKSLFPSVRVQRLGHDFFLSALASERGRGGTGAASVMTVSSTRRAVVDFGPACAAYIVFYAFDTSVEEAILCPPCAFSEGP